jgi:hypothetical protein
MAKGQLMAEKIKYKKNPKKTAGKVLTTIVVIGIGVGSVLAIVKEYNKTTSVGSSHNITDTTNNQDKKEPIIDNRTEEEFKSLCEAKFKRLFLENLRYISRVDLLDFRLSTIDKRNGIVYAQVLIKNYGWKFAEAQFNSEIMAQKSSFKELYQSVKQLSYKDIALQWSSILQYQVQPSTYENFLNMVVSDSKFVECLRRKGIDIESVTDYKDLASIITAKVHDNKNIDIKFIDLNKMTVVVRVHANLPFGDTTPQKMLYDFLEYLRSGGKIVVDSQGNPKYKYEKSYSVISAKPYEEFNPGLEKSPQQ